MEDKFLTAGLIGAISTISAEVITQVCKLLNISKYSDYEISSLIITINRPSLLLGFIIQGVVGAMISISLFYMLKKVGQKLILIKTGISGILAWIIQEIIITALIEGKTIPVRPMSGYYSHLIGAIGYGITVGLLFKRFLFNKQLSQQY